MSSGIRYTEEFKRDAVAQVVDRGYSVLEVATWLGISTKSLYDWKKRYHKPERQIRQEATDAAEIRRLKVGLARVTEERDILKKATAYFAREAK
jgi:transposase